MIAVLKISPYGVVSSNIKLLKSSQVTSAREGLEEREIDRERCVSVSAPGGRGRFWGVAGQGEGACVR